MLSGMDRRTQQDYIGWRAPDLARSGHFRNWSEIVRMLRYEGAYSAHLGLMTPNETKIRQMTRKYCLPCRTRRLRNGAVKLTSAGTQ